MRRKATNEDDRRSSSEDETVVARVEKNEAATVLSAKTVSETTTYISMNFCLQFLFIVTQIPVQIYQKVETRNCQQLRRGGQGKSYCCVPKIHCCSWRILSQMF